MKQSEHSDTPAIRFDSPLRTATFWHKAGRIVGVPTMTRLAALAAALMAVIGTHDTATSAMALIGLGLGILANPKPADQPTRALLRPEFFPRALALVAVVAMEMRQQAGPVISTSLVAIAVTTVLEPTLRSMDEASRPSAVRLPGTTWREHPWFAHRLTSAFNTAAIVAAIARVTFQLPVEIVPIVAALSVTMSTLSLVDTSLNVIRHRAVESKLRELIAAYRPEFLLYWNAPPGTAYQVGMWLPYLERLERRFIVVVRNEENFREVIPLTAVPVVSRTDMEQLDDVVVPSLKAVFYVNNAIRNCHMVRYTNLTHVQLNHGDSDKAPSFNQIFRMYDRDFVAGQAAIDRFAANSVKMPENMFVVVGRPQVERITVATGHISSVANPVVLYAPTWSGFHADSDYSSLHIGHQLVNLLLEAGATVIFRPHPYARKSARLRAQCTRISNTLRAHQASTGRPHLFGAVAETEMSLVDCFNASHGLVSDISSVVVDYLYSEKPLALVNVLGDRERFIKEFPIAVAAYVIDADADTQQMTTLVGTMLRLDALREERQKFKRYYLGDIPAEDYVDRFLTEARSLL